MNILHFKETCLTKLHIDRLLVRYAQYIMQSRYIANTADASKCLLCSKIRCCDREGKNAHKP